MAAISLRGEVVGRVRTNMVQAPSTEISGTAISHGYRDRPNEGFHQRIDLPMIMPPYQLSPMVAQIFEHTGKRSVFIVFSLTGSHPIMSRDQYRKLSLATGPILSVSYPYLANWVGTVGSTCYSSGYSNLPDRRRVDNL